MHLSLKTSVSELEQHVHAKKNVGTTESSHIYFIDGETEARRGQVERPKGMFFFGCWSD